MNNKYTYFNFPLYLVQLTFSLERSEAFDQIIGWSIVNYARRLKLSDKEVITQLDYLYHRNPDLLPDEIVDVLNEYQLFLSEDPFKPEVRNEICADELSKLLREEGLFGDSLDLVGITYAGKKLDISLGSIQGILDNYKSAASLMNKLEFNFGGSPLVGIKTSIVFEARSGAFDLDLFRLLCSISSIIGTRKFNRTHKEGIALRMVGAKNKAQLKGLLRTKRINQFHEKYTKRYQIDKILLQAVSRNLISKIGMGRGIFVSMRYNLKQLTVAVGDKRSKYEAIKQSEKEAREALL